MSEAHLKPEQFRDPLKPEEFRKHIGRWFDRAAQGEVITIKRGGLIYELRAVFPSDRLKEVSTGTNSASYKKHVNYNHLPVLRRTEVRQ